MSKSILKLGFIGGGINSAVGQTHKIALEMDGHFHLVAGCFSRHEEINHQTAQRWGVSSERTYETWQTLLQKEQGKLDAIVVLTPTPTHKEVVISCLKAGFNVICEKAMACDTDEANEIIETYNHSDNRVAITYNYSGYPMIRELKHRIERGDLGKLEQILVEMPQEGYARLNSEGIPQRPQEWRLHDGNLPTISLDLGVHLHQLVDFLTKEKPLTVSAVNSRFGAFSEVVDNIHGLAKYTNDLVCNFWYGKAALGATNGLRVRVFGDKASAEWFQLEPEYLYMNDNRGVRQVVDRTHPENVVAQLPRYNRFKAGHPAGFIEAFANYYVDMATALKQKADDCDESEYVFGVTKALQGLEMLETIQLSASNQIWQKI